jgi:hypothetical protein
VSYLPQFTRLDVVGYEMYPGTADASGLHRDIGPGVTLVVGANGLGKTTLVTLLRHLCAGPARLSNRTGGMFEAGRLRATGINAGTFADRVGDRASDASARLVMEIGDVTFDVTRTLRTLELEALVIDGVERSGGESEFQEAVVAAAGVTDYPDWLLLVDYLVFVSEDRSQPFWDRNVQRQLLRALTRDAVDAGELADAESRHISADSDFRNARVQLGRHKQRFEALAAKVQGTGDINDSLLKLGVEKDALVARIAELEGQIETDRDAYNEALREREASVTEMQLALGSLEAARFALIEAAIPTQDDVFRYLSARLATGSLCPVCGQGGGAISIPESATCLLCGLPVEAPTPDTASNLDDLETTVERAQRAVEANGERLQTRAQSLASGEAALASERTRLGELEGRIRALRAQLPEGGADLGSQAALLADLEADLETLRAALADSRRTLQELLELGNEAVRSHQDEIKRVFDEVATSFLVERCHLVPHQTAIRIGQEGAQFDVQAFDLDLSSSTEVGETLRNTGDDVSESQRVFIDIAFRIALIRSCVSEGRGSLVVDAPEGSLDAVFSTNAAELLAAVVQPSSTGNRLVVASNLVEGSMLPALARIAGIREQTDPRLINLLDIAAPTAAVSQRGDEYRAVLENVLHGVEPGGEAL